MFLLNENPVPIRDRSRHVHFRLVTINTDSLNTPILSDRQIESEP